MTKNLHPDIVNAIAGTMPKFHQTSCSQCGCDTGPGDHGHSTCATHQREPDNSLETITGAGSAPITAKFNISSDGEVEDMQVWMHGYDITRALTEDQITEIEYDCYVDYLTEVKERNADLRIESMRAEREWA